MSIPATNYISSSALEAWMEQKTDDLYGNLRSSMDTSNDRADAEEALNKIKADLADAGKSGAEPSAIREEMQATINKYKDEFPDVAEALQPKLDLLNDRIAKSHEPVLSTYQQTDADGAVQGEVNTYSAPPPAKVTTEEAKDWGDAFGNAVDALSKKDQLGMINIQEFNSQINQTRQIASALLDSKDKSTNAIISHIS